MREPLAAITRKSFGHVTAAQVVDPFAATGRDDRNFFLFLLVIAWAALVSGFGNDVAVRAAAGTLHYPFIVHVHAALFVGWMLLFTTQLLLVRHARIALHRRLGMAGAVLAPAMVVAGIATAIVTETVKFGTQTSDPAFLATLFADMVAFGAIAGAGLLLRGQRASHRRLMLMATLLLTDAGFGRWFSAFIAPNYWEMKGFAEGIGPYLRYQLMPAGSLLLAIGLYDLVTRRRLLPAYVLAFTFWLVVELTAAWLYYSPAWLPIALRLIGH